MTGPLYRLGGFCVRHRRVVVAVWLVVFLALAILARSAGPNLSDNLTLPGTDSQKATALLQERFPTQANGTTPLVLTAPKGGKLSDAKYATPISDTVNALRADSQVHSATSPLSSSGASLLAKDKSVGYIAINLTAGPSELTLDDAHRLSDAADPARHAGLGAAFGGYVGQKLSKPETHSSEAAGLTMAVIVLLFTFGTIVAMGLPIVTALLGLVIGLSIITLLSHVAEVPNVAPTLATMIGLGVGIDYALFIVTRHKDQLRDGMAMNESIARATATSGSAVVFAGCTVIVALLSLFVVGIPLVSTLGYTAAIVVVVAVIAAVTLLPALLGLLGARINRLALPHKARPSDGHPHGWMRWGEFVARRPVPCLVVAVVALGVLAIPTLHLHLGQQDNAALPTDTQSRQSYDGLTKGFGVGTNGLLLVSVDLSAKPAQGDQKAADPRLQTLRDDIQKTHGVAKVTQPLVNQDGKAAILTVTPTTAPSDQKTEALVRHLRDDTIPAATKGQSMTADVGGTTAGYIDLADEISKHLVETILVVIALSFVLLLLAFRSLVIPLTAGLMNLISIGAAFGVVTAVFEQGTAIHVVGLSGEVPIVSFVPLLMFAVLFGLSMDYEVFLISHVREAWERTHDNRTAVVEGIGTTGRVITSAALIMVSVFFAFIINGDPTVKQFGVGMGVAVAVDATLVRCLLVPAVMLLLGRSNWWLPKWLDRVLPNFSIEGEEWFRQRDAAAALALREATEAGTGPPGAPAGPDTPEQKPTAPAR